MLGATPERKQMKSASYYDRKAWDYTNTGNWAARDEMRRLARKARAVAKKRLGSGS